MKISPIILAAALASVCAAQTPVVSEDSKAATGADLSQLPEGQQRLIGGLILLQKLYICLSGITNNDTAEAAVPTLMQLNDQLRQWSGSFSSLPPLSEPEVLAYEDRFLPAIRKMNQGIEAQAARIAAAEYYGSRNLPAALVRLAQIGHQ